MAFTKIEQSEINSGGALRLPDRPSETMPPQAIKSQLDYPAKEVLFPAYNRLIDELEDVTAADSIGAVAPAGVRGNTVQAILNNISSSITGAITTVEELKEDVEEMEGTVEDLAETVGVLEESAHTHDNKDLLDTYTQTETDIADAVTKKHSHDNKSVLDKFGESSGVPTYDGSAIGSVSSVNGQTGEVVLDADDVGALPDDTHIPEISVTQVQTSGVRIAVIEIDGDGTDIYVPEGGAGSGDMKKSDYDSDTTVRNAGGIKTYVTSQISTAIANLMDVTDYDSNSAVKNAGGIGNYVSSQISTKYDTSDTAKSTLADADYIPLYDNSASSSKKILWSTIKTLLSYLFMKVDGSNAPNDLTFNVLSVGARTGSAGVGSFTQGSGNIASADMSHAEGNGTTADSVSAHAEGYNTIAHGVASHAEGYLTTANGHYSHTEGNHTKAGYSYQSVIGAYNNNKSTTLFEVGKGSNNYNRSNAFEVYSDGMFSQDDGATKFEFTSYNSKDGYYDKNSNFHELGNMSNSDYDPNSVVKTAGGIDRYVSSQISTAITSVLTASY